VRLRPPVTISGGEQVIRQLYYRDPAAGLGGFNLAASLGLTVQP